MKIQITATETEINTAVRGIASAIDVFTPTADKADEVITALLDIDNVCRHFPGGRFYTKAARITSEPEYRFVLEVENDMAADALTLLVKGAKVVAPVYHAGIALLNTLKAVTGTAKDTMRGAMQEFSTKWHFSYKYRVLKVINPGMDMYSVVVLQSDGHNKPEVVTCINIGTRYDISTFDAIINNMTAEEIGEFNFGTREDANKHADDVETKVLRSLRDRIRNDRRDCNKVIDGVKEVNTRNV